MIEKSPFIRFTVVEPKMELMSRVLEDEAEEE